MNNSLLCPHKILLCPSQTHKHTHSPHSNPCTLSLGTVQGSTDTDRIPFVNSPQQDVMILMTGSHHGGHVSQQEMS